MNRLRCMIVEDEPIAADIVRGYIQQVGFLSLESVHDNALSALEALKQQPIDLIFLDIHLPVLRGLDFLKSLDYPPRVIITSAYEQYALEGYELDITDYLLKPFSFPRFLKAVNRVNSSFEQRATPEAKEPPHLFFNVNKKMMKVYLSEILYVESLKEYVRIQTLDRRIVTKFQIGELETQLGNAQFMRVHRSFIVARDKIRSFGGQMLEVGGTEVPVGRSYLASVRKEIVGVEAVRY